MLTSDQYQYFFQKAISYESYLSEFKSRIENPRGDGFDPYLPLNWQRTHRLHKTLRLQPSLVDLIKRLKQNIRWLLIAEHWCGDVSQSIPVMAAIAQTSNSHIDFRIAYRDSNPELMDAHLTDGKSRSIPILIQLNAGYMPTGTWGPRPYEAQELVKRLKANPETASSYADELHRWYANDKQQCIQRDLFLLLTKESEASVC
ncbi:MAG: thioredoxin family protein [Bacteroidota bacterium]